jgi:uncharacterized protein YndB with AHSA1/START domain
MLPIILTLGAGVVAAFAVRFVTRGDSFQVERATTVAAPPEKIYPLLANFHEWHRWSPWEGLDPALKRTFTGPESGVGSVYAWAGNKKAGEGRMEIVRADPPNRVSIKLDFLKPFESHNITDFTLTPRGGGTEVKWAMHGPNTAASKMMQTVISMDRLVGGDFVKGLAALKREAEAEGGREGSGSREG